MDMYTDRDARCFLHRALGEYYYDHDTTAILDELRAGYGTWNFSTIDSDEFWAIVQKHPFVPAGKL